MTDMADLLTIILIALYFVAILAMVIVSMLTKKTAEKILNETQTGWYISKQ